MNSALTRLLRAAALLACMLVLITLFVGCGGSKAATPPPTPTPTPTASPTPSATAAQIRIGDAAADSIIDFEFTIGSPVVFTMAGATGAVTLTPGPNRFEMSHMAAKMEPLDVVNVPPATYVTVQLTIQNPELVFLDPTGKPVTVTGSNQTVIIPLNPALTIGNSPAVVGIDVNVANSIIASNGTITGINFTPTSFSFTSKPVAAEAEQQDDNGEVEGMIGKVSAVSGSNFTLDLAGSNSQLIFSTDNTTQFKDGLTTLASALNQLVKVEGLTKADGSLFAKELEGLENESGSELDGLITLVTGNPATSVTFITQDGIGNGMDPAKMGVEFTANVSSSKYIVDQGKCDFSGLVIPGPDYPFGPATIQAGQRVEIENASGVPATNGTFTADKVRLEQQAISGIVSNVVVSSSNAGIQTRFDLTLPADSHLAILSGQTVVHVISQPATNNKFNTTLSGSTVRVRGLLFWTGTTFNMIARRITAP